MIISIQYLNSCTQYEMATLYYFPAFSLKRIEPAEGWKHVLNWRQGLGNCSVGPPLARTMLRRLAQEDR